MKYMAILKYVCIEAKNKEEALRKFKSQINELPFTIVTQEDYDKYQHEQDAKAHARFVTDFMKDTLMNDFDYDEETASDLAQEAYDLYCCGDGQTEYECIEQTVQEYEEDKEK